MYTKVIQRLISISITSILIVSLTCVPIGIADTLTDKKIQRQSQFQLKPNITAEIPHNPNTDQQAANYPETSEVVFIGDFAWQVFVALNWPADCQKGEPLSNKKIGEAPDNPRVWEFYRTPETVFVSEGKEPPPNPTKPLTCLGEGDNLRTAGKTVKLTESGKLTGEDKDANSLLDVPLVDQRGNYIIVETYINQPEFDQILTNKWYDAVNLERFNNDNQFTLVCSENKNVLQVPCSTYKNEGAIEIKAAWRVFDEPNSEEEKSHYYITKRKLSIQANRSATGVEFAQVVEVGLIGFHIKHKTTEQGWIWSTFEQVDNVPDDASTEKQYTLYNPNCKENCTQNDPSVVKKPYLWRQEAPHAVTKIGDKIENQIPSQIFRSPKPILDSEGAQENKQWQKALKGISDSSVWQYYKLIGTQWLTNPNESYNKALRGITPNSPLANVTLEPYQQNCSCIVCHTGAKLPTKMKPYADFSFQMHKAQSSHFSATNAQ